MKRSLMTGTDFETYPQSCGCQKVAKDPLHRRKRLTTKYSNLRTKTGGNDSFTAHVNMTCQKQVSNLSCVSVKSGMN